MVDYTAGQSVEVLAYDPNGHLGNIKWRKAVIVGISDAVNPHQPSVVMWDVSFTDIAGGGAFDHSHIRPA
jgi:hypothetical protein